MTGDTRESMGSGGSRIVMDVTEDGSAHPDLSRQSQQLCSIDLTTSRQTTTMGMMEKAEKGEILIGTNRPHYQDGCSRLSSRWLNFSKLRVMICLLVTCIWVYLMYGKYSISWISPPAERLVAGVPSYVLRYAPLVWLDEGEAHFPSDIYGQVVNTHPFINYTMIPDLPFPLPLTLLDVLNDFGNFGQNVYLTSTIDVTTSPRWLEGVVPDSYGRTNGAVSCAVIISDKGEGLVDVFYMYFYAYNLGNTVFFKELGNHIGDWEHNMIRFQDGKPTTVWFSQHNNGQAFKYSVLEKKGARPISYSARGSHANYAIAGTHDHTVPDLNLPAGFILDFTSKGLLWDPTLNTYFYNYDHLTDTFSSIGDSPVGAMNYRGRWGDKQYPDNDPRQNKAFYGFYKFVGGPSGPWDKYLNRSRVCPDNGYPCIIRSHLGP